MQNREAYRVLGILGGLGPMATVYFYEMLTEHTKVTRDQDHIDMVISSRATTPDRTAFILGQSDENPLPVMVEEANRLIRAGAEVIVLPCNTAHYFYDGLSRQTGVPIINIITETVSYCAAQGWQKVGILATEGTVKAQAYHMIAHQMGLECVAPTREGQAVINSIIYDKIKQGKPVDIDSFMSVAEDLFSCGADKIVLGCTELSLLCREYRFDDRFVDSLKSLAVSVLRKFGKNIIFN
jgi:aspartate racemase